MTAGLRAPGWHFGSGNGKKAREHLFVGAGFEVAVGVGVGVGLVEETAGFHRQ
ncbi:hypothetical protein [Microtetraspora sp. NBRC 16547]|uniref:hypothetical protein n=1 Tax=Microtetraspora sp. NBRC 16547 TaxID=3030993 RepID=UPI0025579292|nr:hypothetical protein [Microtetraspora sp. NBRC 16547]